ncbi:MAG TPA: AMIN domain-containing protein, partial [Candidatus Methanoperedens sp.]|nr:AMIN domain-containing protein [Candidatus Methanoperedens sp.]
MATGRWARRASCGALAVWLLAGCGGRLAQTPDPAVQPAVRQAAITDIKVADEGGSVKITVTTSAKVAYSLVQQASPPRLLLELAQTGPGDFAGAIPVNCGPVSFIRPAASGANSTLEILLAGEAAYDVEGQGERIVLTISPKQAATAVEPAGTPAAAAEPVSPAPALADTAPAAAPAEATTEAPAAPPPVPEPVAAPAAEAPAAAAPAPAAPAPTGPRALTGIDVQRAADGLVVTLQGTGPLAYEYFLVEGKSLVVDIAEAVNKVWPLKKKVGDDWVSQIRIGEHSQPKKATRVVFDLKKVAEYRVEGAGDGIVVSFGAPALAAGPTGGAPAALNTVGEVSCRLLENATRLEIRTTARPDFTIVDSGDPAKVIVEIANAQIPEQNRKKLEFASLDREVVKVSAFPYTKGEAPFVRVVAQLRQPVPFSANVEGERIIVD